MIVSWEIESEEITGSEAVSTPQVAANVITDVLVNVYQDENQVTRAHLLMHVATPLQKKIVGEGADAVAGGGEWSATEGPIRVTLRPE